MTDPAGADLDDVANAWCRYHARTATGQKLGVDDGDWWAVEFWLAGSEVWANEVVVREGLLALIDAATDDLLSYVGAGPLETFISADESRVRWIENQAARSVRFRKALANVWTWGTEPDDVAARLERAAGVPLARPTD